jgi:hypothetical protein
MITIAVISYFEEKIKREQTLHFQQILKILSITCQKKLKKN